MYLGDIVRQILVALIDASPESLLFSGQSSPVFNKQYGFDTSIMSAIEEAWIGDDSSQDAFAHPAFTADFKQENLSPKVIVKLERIRHIIGTQAGMKEDFISLRDAAARRFHFLALFFCAESCEPDCSLGLRSGCSPSCSSEWSSYFHRPDSTGLCKPGWGE